ncbi:MULTISPECIES: TFIIB-type zinc ribbon-containing protein [Actinoalloteichus]|uniref:Uncharacterized protein n=1 Tax=Actinoalloteichus fjordicus TaxID=1612552 RepID=A0AAC9PUW9_9PSEU|nr:MULTISPECIES: TFIIB-type zinc ribbon-containing protein [Actinoalloteichus]APU17376.1 hypothetical protein UA74_26855 [Actinoalloteichus fjordicus]APU23460.1 hypothetical protein UA75_27445 [Actinoalloteichus sp. GBA129-24]
MDTQRAPLGLRSHDSGIHLVELAAEAIDVVCPRCRSRAANTARPNDSAYVGTWPRRLTCPNCAYWAEWASGAGRYSVWGGPVDPFFGVPLWWQAECCGGRTLWALNEKHLDLLERHVAARLRERTGPPRNSSMVSRLPGWLSAAGNRAEVLTTIRRLRAR